MSSFSQGSSLFPSNHQWESYASPLEYQIQKKKMRQKVAACLINLPTHHPTSYTEHHLLESRCLLQTLEAFLGIPDHWINNWHNSSFIYKSVISSVLHASDISVEGTAVLTVPSMTLSIISAFSRGTRVSYFPGHQPLQLNLRVTAELLNQLVQTGCMYVVSTACTEIPTV